MNQYVNMDRQTAMKDTFNRFPLYIFYHCCFRLMIQKSLFFFKSFNSMRKARLSNAIKTFYFPGLYGYDCIKTSIKWTHRPLFMSFLCVCPCPFKIFQTTTFLVSIFYSDDSYYNKLFVPLFGIIIISDWIIERTIFNGCFRETKWTI